MKQVLQILILLLFVSNMESWYGNVVALQILIAHSLALVILLPSTTFLLINHLMDMQGYPDSFLLRKHFVLSNYLILLILLQVLIFRTLLYKFVNNEFLQYFSWNLVNFQRRNISIKIYKCDCSIM